MWFKNLLVYRLPQDWAMTAEKLQAKLAEKPLQPCSGLLKQSRGWVPVCGDERLVVTAGRHWLLALGLEQKLLPASVINQVARERAVELEAQQGFKVGRKAMKDLREQVADELLPRAFALRSSVPVWIDPVGGWLVVNAAAVGKAEAVLEMLNKTLDGLPLELWQTARAPGTVMTDWLAAGEADGAFSIERELELRAAGEGRATVRYANHTLEGEEIRAHIADGKRATRLGLTWRDRVSFVLTESLQIKKVEFLEVIRDQAGEAENEAELFQLAFMLMSGELSQLLHDLQAVLQAED